jgi:hypothetical protein
LEATTVADLTVSNAKPIEYADLVKSIGQALAAGRDAAADAVNQILVKTYWLIGRYIVEFEQGGKDKAEYGSGLLLKLSKDLTLAYGKGFSKSNLVYMRKLYMTFPKKIPSCTVLIFLV